MSQTINAVFEHGMFRPMQQVNLKESAKVAIRIVPLDDWQQRFDSIIRRIHAQASRYSSQEIEDDILQAVSEAKVEKYGR